MSIKKIPLVHHVRELLCDLCQDDSADSKRRFTGTELYNLLIPVLPDMRRSSLDTTIARMLMQGEIKEVGKSARKGFGGGRPGTIYTADLVAINKIKNADGHLLRQMQAADRLADCVKSWK